MHSQRFYTLTASCPDRVGIVARVSSFIAEHQGWILESSYHSDDSANGGRYFMRIEVKADSLPFHLAEFRDRFRPLADELGMVSLQPGTGGVFRIVCDGVQLWERKADGGFPEAKELKQRLRDLIDPERNLGHIDR